MINGIMNEYFEVCCCVSSEGPAIAGSHWKRAGNTLTDLAPGVLLAKELPEIDLEYLVP